MKYKITISYDGTNYVGWQIQPTGIAIQTLILASLKTLLQEEIVLVGASRTDSGVHALGQTAHFISSKTLEKRRFLFGMNSLLPKDIRIIDLEEVADDFHAQYSAKGKIYHYHLYLEKEDDPFKRFYHFHFPGPLSLPKLEEALRLFVGKNDFTSFANKGSSAKTFERTIFRFDLVQQPGGIRIECEGNGFLYKMVRNLIGVSLHVARGKLSIDEAREILQSKDRRKAPPPAPARGLFLMKVHY